MSDANQRAQEARALADNPAFQSIISDIREGAVTAFLNPSASPDMIAAAHLKIQALGILAGAMQSRLTDQAILDKKERQHRGHD